MKYCLFFGFKGFKLREITELEHRRLLRSSRLEKKFKKRRNIKQFKRLWKDHNSRYVYEDVNGGRPKNLSKNLRTPARSSWENVRKISKIGKNVSLLFYKRFSANWKQFTWYLKRFIGQFGILLNER